MSTIDARGLGVCAWLVVAACNSPSSTGEAGVDARADVQAQDTGVLPGPDVVDAAGPGPDAAPDAVTADAGDAGDARVAAPDAGDPCAGALFCETFDSYPATSFHDGQTLGPWRAALHTPGSTMATDGMHTVSGPRALHVHIDNAVTAGGRLFSNGALPILATHPTHLYGRLMMYIDPNGTSVHWTFFGESGAAVAGTPAGRNASYLISSLPHAGVNTYAFVDGLSAAGTDPNHDCSHAGTTPMPTGRWSCLAFELDSSARVLRLSMDGATTPIVSVTDHGTACTDASLITAPWYGPIVSQFYVGAWSFHAMNAPLDVWIDDLVLDSSPVPCPAP